MTRPAITRRELIAGGLCLALAGGAEASAFGTPAPATQPRVAVIGLLLTELLLCLDLPPVAVGNRPLYERLVADPALPATSADMGPLLEPNLELLRTCAPDLIMAADWQKRALQGLTRIAPVAWLSTSPGSATPLDHLQTLFGDIARRVGREDVAERRLASMHGALDATRNRLHAPDRRPAYIVRFMEDGRHAAVFGSRGMIGDVLSRLGIENAWPGRGNAWGTAVIGIEDLARRPDAAILHFDRGAETTRALASLSESPLFGALPAVRENRIAAMPVIYPNGGVASVMRLAAQLADAAPHFERGDKRG